MLWMDPARRMMTSGMMFNKNVINMAIPNEQMTVYLFERGYFKEGMIWTMEDSQLNIFVT